MRRGFTLVELIVVIVILGLLALVSFPAVTKVIDDSKNDAYSDQVKVIEKSAKAWGVEHPTLLPSSGCVKVKVSTLVSNGYISSGTPKNPKNNTDMNGAVKISLIDSKYNYVYETTQTGCSNAY